MIVRWLLLHLCASKSEIRILLRTLEESFDEDGNFLKVKVGKRIARSLRLSLMWSFLTLSSTSPSLLSAGLLSLVAFVVIAVIRLVGKMI